jgi:hypothetical protein
MIACGLNYCDLKQGKFVCLYEKSNEPSGYGKGMKCPKYFSDYWLFKTDLVQRIW